MKTSGFNSLLLNSIVKGLASPRLKLKPMTVVRRLPPYTRLPSRQAWALCEVAELCDGHRVHKCKMSWMHKAMSTVSTFEKQNNEFVYISLILLATICAVLSSLIRFQVDYMMFSGALTS